MAGKLIERIAQAVRDGVAARTSYYAAIQLPDDQELGAPADPARIEELERAIGRRLPDSYRQFLQMHDGWRMVDGAMDLLSVEEMLSGARFERVRQWQEKERLAGDSTAAKSLVIAVSEITPTKLLLDPEMVEKNGEWRVVQHHKGEEYDYASFIDWLEESVEDFRELAAEESGGDDDGSE